MAVTDPVNPALHVHAGAVPDEWAGHATTKMSEQTIIVINNLIIINC